ncbi:hypothetical protein [Chitinolyticbacter meiyuanensis]|uniref:hypothetical protein n=1 Tax=Chitinolyticbacter meiyuanensis TaxID=682798 RepID=UPI001C9E538B|nr:hypothetical protein [Chitinolyticbacter meiyuanensis]
MARTTKAENTFIGIVAIIALPIYLVSKLFEAVGWVIPTVAVVAVIGLIVFIKKQNRAQRIAHLRAKYQDEEIVQNILAERFWIGQTDEQLIDSLGHPHDIDQKVLKTKKKETWKYQHQGANRYRLRIVLDNGVVSGWDQK